MGNTTCCQQNPKQQLIEQHISVLHQHKTQKAFLPPLSGHIQDYLVRQKPFEKELTFQQPLQILKFQDDYYEGKTDYAGRPQGFGKMYKKNGSLFIGEFQSGIANGRGIFINSNGEYYSGMFLKNKADDANGYYWSSKFEYTGGFKDNKFQGHGKQKGPNYHFQGQYQNNTKKVGLLVWRTLDNQSEYEGPFNEAGKFEGKGKINNQQGEYIGDFVNGKKHGFGTFIFENGLKYIGEYYKDAKEGKGKLVNSRGYTTYEGQFKNDVPHGEGKVLKDGKLIKCNFKEGIDVKSL